MQDYLFYIFAAITICSAIFTAFSSGSKTAIAAFIYLLTGACGLIALLNNGQTAAVFILVILLLLILFILGKKYTDRFFNFSNNGSKLSLLPVGMIALLTAVITAVLGAAKWDKFETDPGYNQPVLIFTKYLPVILFSGLAFSILIGYAYKLVTDKSNTK